MNSKKQTKDFFCIYKEADSTNRLEIMLSQFNRFQQQIKIAEIKTQRNIKAEHEYMRSHHRSELGVRIQTSRVSDPTPVEAIENMTLEEAIKHGEYAGDALKDIDESNRYEIDIQTIKGMKENYELLQNIVLGLEDEEQKLVTEYFIEKRGIKELAEKYNISYNGMKMRIKVLREGLRIEMLDSINLAIRKEESINRESYEFSRIEQAEVLR